MVLLSENQPQIANLEQEFDAQDMDDSLALLTSVAQHNIILLATLYEKFLSSCGPHKIT
jgi:hypothetical protein